ncbi:MAG TPA: M48 family peptidase, partial [Mesotoga infera]|nr:M48 family peptidase [Mesotoga infera]
MASFEIVFLLVVYGISLFELTLLSLNYRNARLSRVSLPDNLRDVFNDDLIGKSVDYTRAKGSLAITSSIVSLAALSIGIFWFFRAVESLAVRAAEGFVIQGLLFFIVIGATAFIITLPFSIYSTFALEKRFGFNRTTPGTFVADKLKGISLVAVIGIPIVTLVLLAVDSFAYWWLYLLIGVIVFELLAQLIFPTVILPIFYKLKPLDDEDLMGRLR